MVDCICMTITTALPRVNSRPPYSPLNRTTPATPIAREDVTYAPPFRRSVRLVPATRSMTPSASVETVRLPSYTPLIASQLSPLALIADDDLGVRKCLRIALELSGYRVEEAEGGMQALALLHHKPAVVLLDINMPGLNGFDCLKEIRKRNPEMKVIIISGQIGIEKMGPQNDENVQYIPKPLEVHKLLAAVKLPSRAKAS